LTRVSVCNKHMHANFHVARHKSHHYSKNYSTISTILHLKVVAMHKGEPNEDIDKDIHPENPRSPKASSHTIPIQSINHSQCVSGAMSTT